VHQIRISVFIFFSDARSLSQWRRSTYHCYFDLHLVTQSKLNTAAVCASD